ncbi:unnamed protein product, partial [Leptidea sinapis]
MAENKEEILANFQSITNVDVAEAIFHLEEANWDLLSAINRVMPQDGNTASQTNNTHDVEMIDDDISVITPKTHPPGDLRKRLEAVFGIPVCQQQISGLGGSKASSTALLSSLGLPRNAVLRLKAADRVMADDEIAERLTATYILSIKNEEENGKEYKLSFPGTKTVQEVKNDVYSLLDIPVRHQLWSGWPNITGLDDTVLAMVGLDQPEHSFTIKKAPIKQKEYKR